MACQVIWSQTAVADLRQIVEFIALDDPAAAANLADHILNHIEAEPCQASAFGRSLYSLFRIRALTTLAVRAFAALTLRENRTAHSVFV